MQHEPALGRYDLRIRNASYERDNGDFECRKVEFGTGTKLHSSMIQLVVLLPPSQPILTPTLPTVTEGRAFNLSCSSLGGSPPPEILWCVHSQLHCYQYHPTYYQCHIQHISYLQHLFQVQKRW